MPVRLTRKDSFIVLLSFSWTGGLSEGWLGVGGKGRGALERGSGLVN